MECEFCEKVFSNKTNLKRHQKTVASCLELKGKTLIGYICDYCNGSYAEKSGLNRHLLSCKVKRDVDIKQDVTGIKVRYNKKISKLKRSRKEETTNLKRSHKEETTNLNAENEKLRKIIEEKNEEIVSLKVKYESGKVEVYDKVCNKVLDKSTVTNNTNTAYFHPKLVNLPITNIHPLTSDYVKEQVDNGNYTFDHYLKGPEGLTDFIYSITMCENDDGETERNFVCTDTSRDSYHRLVETKEWQKDKGGKFIDVILDTLSPKADGYHKQLLDERIESKGYNRKKGYDPESIYKSNNDMHTGIVRSHGPERRNLRLKLKKETSKKISV